MHAETDLSTARDGGITSQAAVSESRASMDVSLTAVLSLLTQQVEKGGPFNVDNRYVMLPRKAWETELRPELRAAAGHCNGLVKPRLRWNGSETEGQTGYDYEFFVNTALVKCKASPSLDIALGRQSIQWGNGQLRSPSNPFFAENLQFNPAQEVLGKDFITLAAQTQREWSGMLIVHTGDNHIDPDKPYFRRNYGLKMDWVGEASTGGVIWSQRNGRPPRLGGHWTTTWSDATLLYGEATISRDAAGFVPTQNSGSIRMEPAQEVSNDHRYTVLLGASYTFENGVPTYVEYLNTTEGLSATEAALWKDLAHQVTRGVLIPGDQIGRMIDPRWRQTRRNYALFQIAIPDEKERGDIALRYVVNMDDHGSTLALATTYNVGSSGQWFLYAARNFGGPETEFGRLQKYAIQTGIRIYGF